MRPKYFAHFRQLLALPLVATLMLSNANAQTQCDPNGRKLDRIRQVRIANDLDGATRLLNEVLKSSPDDFRANYTKGLIIIDRSGLDRPGTPDWNMAKSGIEVLVKTAATLERRDQKCAKEGGWYGILNTIGVEYYNVEDIRNAEVYLNKALGKVSMLDQSTKARLYANLGLLYFAKGDYLKSLNNYRLAQSAGDTRSGDKIRQLTARGIQK